MKGNKPVIVITGPTASGKTKVSIELAKRINGEIISADSMQIYKYMDIGTAKVTEEEKQGIMHHLLDIVDPRQTFSVAEFKELALQCIREITQKGKNPIIAGGTGLYINALIYNVQFSEADIDENLRKALEKEALEKGNEYLYEKLAKIDPVKASQIHKNNLKRIIRALEVYEKTKKAPSYHESMSMKVPPEYNFIVFGINMKREVLYDRINRRVDMMMESGLVEEVENLYRHDMLGETAIQGLGYKEIIWYLRGEATLDEAVRILKRNTRRYAKRQMTWFKRIDGIIWINVDELTEPEEITKKIIKYIETHGII